MDKFHLEKSQQQFSCTTPPASAPVPPTSLPLQQQSSSGTTINTAASTPNSRPPSRRTSTIIPREPLPSPPPDPRSAQQQQLQKSADNIFVYPPAANSKQKELPIEFHGLFKYAERQEEFKNILNKSILADCKQFHGSAGAEQQDDTNTQHQNCHTCAQIRKECEETLEPLQYRLNASITAAMAAHGAVEQLNSLYSMWEQYLVMERKLRKEKECLRYVRLLEKKLADSKASAGKSKVARPLSDTEIDEKDFQQSLEMLEAIFKPEHSVSSSFSRSQDFKLQRERSKSFMIEDMPSLRADRSVSSAGISTTRSNSGMHYLLRRQSTYSDGSKSKVSKWTKVKAAFKWEKANVPALNDGTIMPVMLAGHHRESIGLQPINNEVARYLRVPSLPCGNSSADSMLSSSSGHLLSDAGTPGTISSASSMDDIDNAGHHNVIRRDSSKSDIVEQQQPQQQHQTSMERPSMISSTAIIEIKPTDRLAIEDKSSSSTSPASSTSPSAVSGLPPKSSSNKSLRKCKAVPDFEVVPEDVEAVIQAQTKRKNRNPPSPLNLNLKQDLNDSDHYYTSPHLLKVSPINDGTQSLNRTCRRISSPINSSVPSSPSRHSEHFFAEFESEDLSSGDFSEPNSPNHMSGSGRHNFEQQQQEINRRYQILQTRLDKEFETKRKEWEKLKTNRALNLVSAPKPPEPISPNANLSSNISAKLLEENLTPDFKKKLQKWRVKKQASIGGIQAVPMSPTSGSSAAVSKENANKIDWHLWKTGQLKLEGQGLTPLPDQKDLPEDFQKKLEQWNKIKRGGSSPSCSDSIKRGHKHGGSGKSKGESDDDRAAGFSSSMAAMDKRLEKQHKPHDKEKSERLAKLKAIVGEHPAKEIEVKTSAGVMKFEGISRKFTRKLYEWEKARGIGPESSTFALLHPGYCPIDVKRISKETHTHENSPTLSRSLSLDSISPSMAVPVISQQASSLSLNDVNDLKEMEECSGVVSSSDALTTLSVSDYNKKYDEPEAVMVEVEDHIVETASPLVMTNPWDKQQMPVYKYEEKTCNDYCNTRKIQSFESHTNLAPLLNVLKNSEELLKVMKQKSSDIGDNNALRSCESTLALIRSSYSYYADNLIKPSVLTSILDVQNELSRLRDLCEKSPLDEACCQETMAERNVEYNEEFHGLLESLEVLKQNIQGGLPRFSRDIVPDINITSEDGLESSYIHAAAVAAAAASKAAKSHDQQSPTLEATDELSTSVVENDTETSIAIPTITIPLRTSNGSANNGSGNGNGASSGTGSVLPKKKTRLRKMGSRQNSKTESDSSDDDNHSILETPRRLKRKNYRLKQRSFDEDPSSATIAEDVVYTFKVKPPIHEGCEATASATIKPAQRLTSSTSLPNVFVKTKRKLFTAVQQPNAIDGVAVIEHEIQHNAEAAQGDASAKKEQPRTAVIEKQDSNDLSRKLRELELQVKPRILLAHKSISLDDIRSEFELNEEKRKSYSLESLKNLNLEAKDGKTNHIRAPLATDSFRLNSSKTSRESPLKLANLNNLRALLGSTAGKKQHLYKKHSDRLSSSASAQTILKAGALKKIEQKIVKTNSGSLVTESEYSKLLSANKVDNTVPRIIRKLERKSLTPTSKQLKFDFPMPANSEPTSPVLEMPPSKPMTPLSERAIRLQKAKEEFLKSKPLPKCELKLRDNAQKQQYSPEKRQSDISLSSVNTTADEASMYGELLSLPSELSSANDLHKSISADTIRAETPPTQSDTGTDQDIAGIYDSLPRQVTRSGKISSKLGFATLASKLKKVKGAAGTAGGQKKTKDNTKSFLASRISAASAATTAMGAGAGAASSALSALCRQSLFADIIAVPQIISDDNKPTSSSAISNDPTKLNARPTASEECVKKSQSSPHAILRGSENSSGDLSRLRNIIRSERLNKSQSEQLVKRHKESYV